MRVSRPALVALIVGMLATGGLSWVSYVLDDHNETHLLNLETREAAAILQVVVPVIETPLSSAAQIAATNGGQAQPFGRYISSYVGSKGPFVSASLWEISGGSARMVTVAGSAPVLARTPESVAMFLGEAARKPTLQVTGPIEDTPTAARLGFAFAAPDTEVTYVVYAESALPGNRRAPVDNSSPLADLRFALYLGTDRRDDHLLETNAGHLPISGRRSVV
ncbi:MAG: hypothetical protein QOG80_345, partial [Pseudonocardiales bacterium]|nr:hypothetical protein [Pseudonocardiales bacterium]